MGAFALVALLSGCAYTTADVQLPDGTTVHIRDNKSREGVILSWQKTGEGYSVFLSSQKSGTDPAASRLAEQSLGLVRELLPLAQAAPGIP